MDAGWCRNLVLVAFTYGLLALTALGVVGGETVTQQAKGRQVCIGHFQLELPASARVSITGSYKGIEVEREPGSGDFSDLVRGLRARADALGARAVERDAYAEAIYRSGGVDPAGLFGETQLLGFDVDEEGRTVALGYHKKSGSPGIAVEVHKLLEQGRYRFETENLGAQQYDAVRNGVLRASSRFHPLEPGQVPQQSGFCVGNGMFVEDGPDDVGGDATLVAHFPEYPHVTFSVDVSGILSPSKEGGLQSRIDGEMGFLSRIAPGVRTLRRGERPYAGQDGFLMAVAAEDEDGRVVKYFWGADGVPRDRQRPLVEVQLMVGESGPSELSEDEVGALWDSLMAGFRLR